MPIAISRLGDTLAAAKEEENVGGAGNRNPGLPSIPVLSLE